MLTMIALYMHAKQMNNLKTCAVAYTKRRSGERCWYAGGRDDDHAARGGSGRGDRAGAGGGGVLGGRARDHPGQRGEPYPSGGERGRDYIEGRGSGAAADDHAGEQ